MVTPLDQYTALLGSAAVVPWSQLDDFWQTALAQVSPEPPSCVVYPGDLEQLAAAVATAHEHRWRLLPCGHGSKVSWGGLATGIDVVISTAGMMQPVDHAVGDLTVTASAGQSLAALQDQLAQAGQFLAVDPTYPQRATLGGIVATADTGALRQRYGGIRDTLIGVRFVRHDGEMVKAGGRVVKNVAGYDLMKLMTGSFGSLGVLAELTFRTYPQAPAAATVLLAGEDGAVSQALAELRRSPLTPVALDLLSPALMVALGHGPTLGLAARFETVAAGVAEQVTRLLSQGQGQGLQGQALEGEAGAQLWDRMTQMLGEEAAILAKVGCLPVAAATLLRRLDQLGGLGRIHTGSGVGMVALGEGHDSLTRLEALRSHCQEHQGYLTLLQAPLELKQQLEVWGYRGNALAVMGRIKQQFDPQRCLSPGRFVGGL